MKTNLKSFPNWNMPIPDYEEAKRNLRAIWNWREDFEKELQEKYDTSRMMQRKEVAEFIKEILGEA